MFGCWVGFFAIPWVSDKASGESGAVYTWWVQLFCDIFGKKGDAWHMILGNNHAGYDFVLRDLVLIELFQISHNCVTKCSLQAKVKTYLKVIGDTFFPNVSNFRICDILSNRRRRFKILACRETPSPLPSSFA